MRTITEFDNTIIYFDSDDMVTINSESSVAKILDAARQWLYSGNYTTNYNSARYQAYLIRYQKAVERAVTKMGIDPTITRHYNSSFGDLMS